MPDMSVVCELVLERVLAWLDLLDLLDLLALLGILDFAILTLPELQEVTVPVEHRLTCLGTSTPRERVGTSTSSS